MTQEKKIVLRGKVDHKKITQYVKTAIAEIEATPDEQRIDMAMHWMVRVFQDCITFEVTQQ